MHRPALVGGTIFAALAVIIGAFGAHSLRDSLTPDLLQVFETGVKYQFYHAFALLATGIIHRSYALNQLKIATIFFYAGIVLFSGSLYILTLLKMNGEVGLWGIGALTPIGGLCFIAGWVFLLLGVLKKKKGA